MGDKVMFYFETSVGGFRMITEDVYAENKRSTLMLESSAIDPDLEGSFNKPGSSYLWIGDDFHLNRAQVRQFIICLEYWMKNKRLPTADEVDT